MRARGSVTWSGGGDGLDGDEHAVLVQPGDVGHQATSSAASRSSLIWMLKVGSWVDEPALDLADGPGGDLGGVDPEPRPPGRIIGRVVVGGPGPDAGIGHRGGGAVDVAPAVDGRRPLVDQVDAG